MNQMPKPIQQHCKQNKSHRHAFDNQHDGIAEGHGKPIKLAIEPGEKSLLGTLGMPEQHGTHRRGQRQGYKT